MKGLILHFASYLRIILVQIKDFLVITQELGAKEGQYYIDFKRFSLSFLCFSLLDWR